VVDWPRLYELAVAAGHGETVASEEERVAAADELLAHTLVELVTLGELAALAGFPRLERGCRAPLARTCAAVLRLLDRALAAHARDVGYSTRVWR
jgi:hypothetical protein